MEHCGSRQKCWALLDADQDGYIAQSDFEREGRRLGLQDQESPLQPEQGREQVSHLLLLQTAQRYSQEQWDNLWTRLLPLRELSTEHTEDPRPCPLEDPHFDPCSRIKTAEEEEGTSEKSPNGMSSIARGSTPDNCAELSELSMCTDWLTTL